MGMKNWCRHFTGIQNETCKEGIRYDSVRVKPETGMYQWPCLFSGGSCEKQSAYTAEEIAEREEEIVLRTEGMLKARAAIVESVTKTSLHSGSIACPVCETGNLAFTRAKLNGHIHASCSTVDCVRWME